jgi:hypothetical protein
MTVPLEPQTPDWTWTGAGGGVAGDADVCGGVVETPGVGLGAAVGRALEGAIVGTCGE